MGFFLLTQKGSMLISGFNLTEDGKLWVTKMNGQGIKVAEGEKAERLHTVLLDLAWSQYPCIVENNQGHFGTNVNMQEDIEEEYEEEVE